MNINDIPGHENMTGREISDRIMRLEMANLDAEQALLLMDPTEAGAFLTPSDPIPNLDEHGAVMHGTYEPIHSMEIEGHKVGWLKFTSNNFPDNPHESLKCECDFEYELRDTDDGHQQVVRTDTGRICWPTKIALAARRAVIADGYGLDTRNRLREDFDFRASYDDAFIKDVITDLVKRVNNNGEWVGNWDGSFIGALAIFEILGIPMGGNETIERVQPWKYLDDMIHKGRLKMTGDLVLTIPNQDGIAMPEAEKIENPGPLAQWEDNEAMHPDLVWFTRLDQRYLVEVHRVGTHNGTLHIYDHLDNDTQLYSNKVGLAYGAIMGPDVDDVSLWQQTAIDFVDQQNAD